MGNGNRAENSTKRESLTTYLPSSLGTWDDCGSNVFWLYRRDVICAVDCVIGEEEDCVVSGDVTRDEATGEIVVQETQSYNSGVCTFRPPILSLKPSAALVSVPQFLTPFPCFTVCNPPPPTLQVTSKVTTLCTMSNPRTSSPPPETVLIRAAGWQYPPAKPSRTTSRWVPRGRLLAHF